MQPTWLLDIDGVVNATSKIPDTQVWPASTRWIERLVEDSKAAAWRILAAQPVLDFIWSVHEGSYADIVWLTSWQTDAQLVADALSLPQLRTIEAPMTPQTKYAGRSWWKLAEATREGVAGQRLVWTDDHISEEITSLGWDDDCLLIAPDAKTGLTPDQLKQIAVFLEMR